MSFDIVEIFFSENNQKLEVVHYTIFFIVHVYMVYIKFIFVYNFQCISRICQSSFMMDGNSVSHEMEWVTLKPGVSVQVMKFGQPSPEANLTCSSKKDANLMFLVIPGK